MRRSKKEKIGEEGGRGRKKLVQSSALCGDEVITLWSLESHAIDGRQIALDTGDFCTNILQPELV